MVQVTFFITLILSIAYALFICWCIAGWSKLKDDDTISLNDEVAVMITVIIPARNESQNIYNCLSDFPSQNYPAQFFEVIVVDDHSTDGTSGIVEKFKAENPQCKIKLLRMNDIHEGTLYKKQAISSAVSAAAGTLIVTTDADCRRGKDWLSSLAGNYKRYGPELISAPVIYTDEINLLEKIQSLEFLGLVAIGAAAIANGHPFLCNGANLTFSKAVFVEAGGYDSAKHSPSGDDTQLMLKIVSRGKERIRFVKSLKATVTTKAEKSVGGFFSQRKRWASKIPVHMNLFTLIIALTAYLLHTGLLVSGVLVVMYGNVTGLILPLLIKMLPEFILLWSVSKFFKKASLLYLFLPAQVIYPIYISFVGLASLTGTYKWKGRHSKQTSFRN